VLRCTIKYIYICNCLVSGLLSYYMRVWKSIGFGKIMLVSLNLTKSIVLGLVRCKIKISIRLNNFNFLVRYLNLL